jgi:hypothetical protein
MVRLSVGELTHHRASFVLHTIPSVAQSLFVTDGPGEFHVAAIAGPAPPGLDLYFQFIVKDTASIHGITLSNAVKGTTP